MNEKKVAKDGILGQRKVSLPIMSYDATGLGPRFGEGNPEVGADETPENVKYWDEKIQRLERQVDAERKQQELDKLKQSGQGLDTTTQMSLMQGAGELLKASAEATKTQSEMWREKSASPSAESTAVQTLGTIANSALAKAMAPPQGQSGPSTDQLVILKLMDLIGGKGTQEPVVKYIDAKVDSMNKDVTDLKSTFGQWVNQQNQQNNPEVWLSNFVKLKTSIDTLSEPKSEVRQGISDTMALELKKIDLQLENMRQQHEINMKESDRKFLLMQQKFDFDQKKEFIAQRDRADTKNQMLKTFKKIAGNVVESLGEEKGAEVTQPQGFSDQATKIQCGQCGFVFPVEGSPQEVECPRCGTKLHQNLTPGSSPKQ